MKTIKVIVTSLKAIRTAISVHAAGLFGDFATGAEGLPPGSTATGRGRRGGDDTDTG
jgi:hypothetical protein